MNKVSQLAACLALPLCVSGFAPVAHAATANTTFQVSATVVDSCNVSATPLVFGNYDSLTGGVLDASATINPQCTSGTYYSIALDAGQGTGASLADRRLTGHAGATLGYGIYANAERTIAWGDGTAGTSQSVNTGTGGTQPVTMYGRVRAEQNALVGSYVDTITLTVSY